MKKASEELESFAFKLEETREKSFMLKSIVKMVEELENGQNDYAVSNMVKLIFNELNKDLFEECDELEDKVAWLGYTYCLGMRIKKRSV